MNKTPYCYKIQLGYEEVEVRKTLKESIKLLRKNYDNAFSYYKDYSRITAQFDDGTEKNVNLRDFILKVAPTDKKIKQIERLVDLEIEKTEKYLSSLTHTVTGYFGITRDKRGWAIKNEKDRASYIWDEKRIKELE